MKYIEGKSLHNILFIECLELIESVKIQIGIEIAQGLDYMHTRDPAVIHQDIKLENIMVVPNTGHAYICDLGIAKLHNVLASLCTTRGQGAGKCRPYRTHSCNKWFTTPDSLNGTYTPCLSRYMHQVHCTCSIRSSYSS
ncbi:hypothetical protein EMCRGX_G026837 [Ephydatia muelleri]